MASTSPASRASPDPSSAFSSFRHGKSTNVTVAAEDDHRISFVCQRCLQPLRVDPSFYVMNEHILAELRLPVAQERPKEFKVVPNTDNCSSQDQRVLFVPPFEPNNSDLFTLMDESGSDIAAPYSGAMGVRLKTTAELFDLISNSGDIDHPLCEECTDTMLESMDRQLKLAEEEAQEYQAYLGRLSKETEEDSQVSQLEAELQGLLKEEEDLRDELTKLKDEEKKAEKELQEQISARDKLEREETKYWKEYSKYKRELLLAEDDYKSLDCTLKYTQGQLERLKKMNVFNATFYIWHTGHFATINGFRLGRLPSVPVEWSEINAAWGHTAFLLSSLAKAVGMEEFQRYKLVPYGNYSYLKVLADNKTLPLYGTGGFRMIFDSKFDSAMVAFLDCLQQFAATIEQQGGFSLPYHMEKGKIKDNNTGQFYSIKLQFNSEDSWTKALRYMLTNLKWGLAFVSTKYMKQEAAAAAAAAATTAEPPL